MTDTIDEVEARAARKFEEWKARHPATYAEFEAYAYLKLAPPLKYRSGPLPGFVQMVLDQLTRDAIREHYARKSLTDT